MKCVDAGHKYKLASLDGDAVQTLTFVKRYGDKYPGNNNAYPGVTIQEVCRVLIDRLKYVNAQMPAPETGSAIWLLRKVIWILEKRAARLHNRAWSTDMPVVGIEFEKQCPHCGHIKHKCAV
jgi:hypothetical protein